MCGARLLSPLLGLDMAVLCLSGPPLWGCLHSSLMHCNLLTHNHLPSRMGPICKVLGVRTPTYF